MFTGIVEGIGTVKMVRPGVGGAVVCVKLGELAGGVKAGDSVGVNGVCLTVSAVEGSVCEFDVSEETLSKSTMDKVRSGQGVNVERAMAADGRFGGHFVLGHVDGTAKIKTIEKKGEFAVIHFSAEERLLDEMVEKGSVCVDGISLTLAKMDARGFSVAVIPTTLEGTTLRSAKAGDEVNIETDIISKMVMKQLRKFSAGEGGLTAEKLKEFGF